MFGYYSREDGSFTFSSNVRSESIGYYEMVLPPNESGYDYRCVLKDGFPTLEKRDTVLPNDNAVMLNALLAERKELIEDSIVEIEDELEFAVLTDKEKKALNDKLTAWRRHRYEFRKYTINAAATEILPLPKECENE